MASTTSELEQPRPELLAEFGSAALDVVYLENRPEGLANRAALSWIEGTKPLEHGLVSRGRLLGHGIPPSAPDLRVGGWTAVSTGGMLAP